MELITIPDGNTLLNSWHLWQFLCLAMVTQAFVFLIYGLRYAKVILWGTFILLVFLPLLAVINRGYKGGGITPAETIFFAFVSHPGIFWGVTIVALVVGQFWCESRFVSSEH